MGEMQLFFRISVLYLVAAFAVITLVREDSVAILVGVYLETKDFLPGLAKYALLIVLAGGALMLAMGQRVLGAKLKALLLAFFGIVLFQAAFSTIKTTIPIVVPFYADPFFADLDRWLHGGVDPWVIVYAWDQVLPIGQLVTSYMTLWSLPALGFPMILALIEPDPARMRRYLILYVTSWILVGNLLAMAGSSVGPVFYDRLLGGDRFAVLTAALAAGGVAGTMVETVQSGLWTMYDQHAQVIGSGISAFPSVHLSTTMVVALYMGERLRWLIPVGVLLVAHILILSVYTGYHYAVDGYASIVMMGALWWALSTRAAPVRVRRAAPIPAE